MIKGITTLFVTNIHLHLSQVYSVHALSSLNNAQQNETPKIQQNDNINHLQPKALPDPENQSG